MEDLESRLDRFPLDMQQKGCLLQLQTALRGSLNAAKRAVPHLIANKVVSTIADAARKRKRVAINVKHSQEPQSKKALVDTGPDINALIDGSGIVLD